MLSCLQTTQELGLAAVAFVKRQPVEVQAIANGVVVQFQADLPFRPVDHVIRDARFAATRTIIRPVLGQEQVTVEQAVKIVAGIAQVYRDGAVLLLADATAPLPLDAGRLVAFLGETGFVQDADADAPRRVPSRTISWTRSRMPVLVPLVLAQELLQGSRCHTRLDGDRLDALLRQVRQLPVDIRRQMLTRILAAETVLETLRNRVNLGFNRRTVVHPCQVLPN